MSVKQDWLMCCPKCGADDQIDIAATVMVRLYSDGTLVNEETQSDHEWDDNSHCCCRACDHSGIVEQFKAEG